MKCLVRFSLRLALSFVGVATVLPTHASDRTEMSLSGPGWRVWLDRSAEWKNDPLFFPTPSLTSLPVRIPSGGWDVLGSSQTTPMTVPGTVEECLQTTPGPEGDVVGVSWWSRTLDVPSSAAEQRVLLRFDSVRERAEIFVNRRLVGYNVVGSTPFEIDITDAVQPGHPAELSVRVTDPGGNFDWRDSRAMKWGTFTLPMSHGFGGITGRVQLVICDPVHVADLAVLNLPPITEATALVTLRNTTPQVQQRDLELRVVEKRDPAHEVFKTVVSNVSLQPGETEVPVKIAAPGAQPWDLEQPNLYLCEARILNNRAVTDSDRRVFGFRWFTVDGVGTDAVFRLNGKRIVLRTAISWGFWPINGIYPTEELAERQIRTAKELGLNMLNFHRAIGNPIVFEKADELGLLYFEEPGAYKSADGDAFGHQIVREKFLRMVRRDRSHPSLVIYNLINEWDSRNPHPNPKEVARHKADLEAAHRVDPSRLVVHTSAWARAKEIEDPAKMHLRPYDDRVYLNGWYDVHHAGGPAVYNEPLYRNPTDFHLFTDNAREIVFWGEEGAISTPPRLEKIHTELARTPRLGWDGAGYETWYREFGDFLDRKELRPAFPTVDSITSAMGNVSLYHQGRRIENIRISNVTDGYAINGWESELIENHSGIVDCFRNPKGDPHLLAYYNQPLYVAVKARNTVVETGTDVTTDFFVVNEKNLRGTFKLQYALRGPSGEIITQASNEVKVTGADTYGELLVPAVSLHVPDAVQGMCAIEAALIDANGTTHATGKDQVLAVNWRNAKITGSGAVWETGNRVGRFLGSAEVPSPSFTRNLGRLDWLVAARAPGEGDPMLIPAEVLSQRDRPNARGLTTTIFKDRTFSQLALERVDPTVAFAVDGGAAPDPALSVMSNYGVRWEGMLTPRADGKHSLSLLANGRVRAWVNDSTTLDFTEPRAARKHRADIVLRAGVPVKLKIELAIGEEPPRCELSWIEPESDPSAAADILERVSRDGTTLIVLDGAEAWLTMIAQSPYSTIRYKGSFRVGKTWLGGIHFVKNHPLFQDLPVDRALDWPYQRVVQNGDERTGLLLEGEELVAGCYHSFPMQLGSAVGVFPLGKGRVIFSTLDITANLNESDGPAAVARKLFSNYLQFANRPAAK